MKIVYEQNTNSLPASVTTIGFFDGVHLGHRYLINQVKELAERHHLASSVITFTNHPRKVIHTDFVPKLLSTPEEKLELLTEMNVDYCFLLNFTKEVASYTAKEFMQHIRDKFNIRDLVIGYDHRFGHNRAENFVDYVHYGKELGINVIQAQAFLETDVTVSSSVVRRYLQAHCVTAANECLGYTYFIKGKVVEGHHIGKSIGFPTANIVTSNPDKLIPVDGAYTVDVEVSGKRYRGMLNIGDRPTLDNGTERTIEVNIFDFNADIYGELIKVYFLDYIRTQRKFDSLDELKEQLNKDKVVALSK
jgi:riboflavin kinase / FMN adenylyltransferase